VHTSATDQVATDNEVIRLHTTVDCFV